MSLRNYYTFLQKHQYNPLYKEHGHRYIDLYYDLFKPSRSRFSDTVTEKIIKLNEVYDKTILDVIKLIVSYPRNIAALGTLYDSWHEFLSSDYYEKEYDEINNQYIENQHVFYEHVNQLSLQHFQEMVNIYSISYNDTQKMINRMYDLI